MAEATGVGDTGVGAGPKDTYIGDIPRDENVLTASELTDPLELATGTVAEFKM